MLLAIAGAIVQPVVVADPGRDLAGYLTLWIAVAVGAAIVPAVDLWRRQQEGWSLRSSLVRLAYEQLAPAILAGGLVTAVIARCQPQLAWLLPGLWSIIFSLGLFASFRLLPRAVAFVAAWYLIAGCLCVAAGPERAGFGPWTMGFTFGLGQAAIALVLWLQPWEAIDGE